MCTMQATSGLLSFLSRAAGVAPAAALPSAVQQPSTPRQVEEALPLAWRRTAWPDAASAQAAAAAAASLHADQGSTMQRVGGEGASAAKPAARPAGAPGFGSGVGGHAGDSQPGTAHAAAQLAGRLLDAWAECG